MNTLAMGITTVYPKNSIKVHRLCLTKPVIHNKNSNNKIPYLLQLLFLTIFHRILHLII